MNIADPKQYDVFRLHLKQKIENCLGLIDERIAEISLAKDTAANALEAKRQFGKVEAYMDIMRLLFTDDYDEMLNNARFQGVNERMKRLQTVIDMVL